MTKYLDSTGLSRLWSKVKALVTAHTSNKSNPHGVTKAQVGLGNVDNTRDATKAVHESRLLWGDTNIVGDISPIDAAMSSLHSANRAEFANPKGITIEYSNDGGSTWLDYGADDANKIALLSAIGTGPFSIGKHNTFDTVTINDQLRITVNANKCFFHTRLKKILINISGNGASGCRAKVESATIGAPTTWLTHGIYDISGWSGWNSIPFDCTFGGGSSQTNQTDSIRFTFSISKKDQSTNKYASNLTVTNILFFGTTYWNTNSTLARTGHLYEYDVFKNATFPAQVTATQFNGLATRANADSDGNTISTTYIKSSDATDATNTEIDAMIANDSDGQYVLLKSDVTNADIDAMMV